MMRITIIALAWIGLALASPAQMGMPALPDADAPPAPIAQMYALYAHGAVPEKPHMDDRAKPIASLLEDLPFTSYELVALEERELPWGEETLFPISALYSMYISALPSDEEGLMEVLARVEMLQDNGDYARALDTRALAAARQALLFRGMPLHRGELVIVLLLAMPGDDNGDGTPDEDDSDQPEETPEQDEDEDPDADQQDTAAQEQDTDDTDETDRTDVDETMPEDIESLEALLESLEDIDRQEQREELRRRDRIDIKGDWW